MNIKPKLIPYCSLFILLRLFYRNNFLFSMHARARGHTHTHTHTHTHVLFIKKYISKEIKR